MVAARSLSPPWMAATIWANSGPLVGIRPPVTVPATRRAAMVDGASMAALAGEARSKQGRADARTISARPIAARAPFRFRFMSPPRGKKPWWSIVIARSSLASGLQTRRTSTRFAWITEGLFCKRIPHGRSRLHPAWRRRSHARFQMRLAACVPGVICAARRATGAQRAPRSSPCCPRCCSRWVART